MTNNYTNVYTYDAAGNSTPHDDLADACAWLVYHNDDDETAFVTKVEFDENDRFVWAWNITKDAAEKLARDWFHSPEVMTENPHPLAETVIDIDWTRYDIRTGIF